MIFVVRMIVLMTLANGVRSEALNLSSYDRCVNRTDGYVCYSAVDATESWENGESACLAKNMTMLEILTESENNAVLDLLTKKGMVDSWLAAVQSTDTWRWLDGVELGDQGCFVDNDTSPDMEYVVDFPSNNSVTNCIAHCGDLSYYYAGVEAGTRCRCGDRFGKYGQEGANCGIVCPGNTNEGCGGDRPTSQQIYAVNGAPANWLGGQPNNNNGYQSCATMDSGTQYRWQDVFCRDGYKAICEIPFANNICSNSTLVNGRCLMLTDQDVNFFNSRFACRSFGGDLVMHLTPADNLAITNWLNLPPNSTAQFHIGLTKWQWKWETGNEFLYTNWKYDQPTGPDFNCITIKQDSNSGAWVAISCDMNHLYVCQKSNATVKVSAPLFTLAPTTPRRTAPTTTPRRTEPPPLPTITQGLSVLSSLQTTLGQSHQSSTLLDQSQHPSENSSSSVNSTSHSTNNKAAIIGGAVAGGVLLLILIFVVIAIIAICGPTCCSRRREGTKEKGEMPETESPAVPAPSSYFFGIDTTPKYRSGDKPSHASIPSFDFKMAGSTFGRIRKSQTPDVVPIHSHPMATPYDGVMETRTQPKPYSSDIYINPELSY